jgi:hypothetical protein
MDLCRTRMEGARIDLLWMKRVWNGEGEVQVHFDS